MATLTPDVKHVDDPAWTVLGIMEARYVALYLKHPFHAANGRRFASHADPQSDTEVNHVFPWVGQE